jgi:hypothetical protein
LRTLHQIRLSILSFVTLQLSISLPAEIGFALGYNWFNFNFIQTLKVLFVLVLGLGLGLGFFCLGFDCLVTVALFEKVLTGHKPDCLDAVIQGGPLYQFENNVKY